MVELTLVAHAPLDMDKLAAIFDTEEDLKLAHPDAHWPFEPGEWLEWLDPADGNAPYFIEVGGARAGHLVLRTGDVAQQRHLAWLFLRAQYRGGRGAEILALAEAAALREHGATFLTLRVERSNPRALNLYRKNGYVVIDAGADNFLMRKDLPGRPV